MNVRSAVQPSCSTPDSKFKWLSELTSWLRLVRLLRLYPLLRSLVVLSLTVRRPQTAATHGAELAAESAVRHPHS